MTTYLVMRLTEEQDGVRTGNERVILNHMPSEKSAKTQIRRTHEISDWRYVGRVDSARDDLDRLTDTYGLKDTDLLRRTGVDVRQMVSW